jgi:hypothetical protein
VPVVSSILRHAHALPSYVTSEPRKSVQELCIRRFRREKNEGMFRHASLQLLWGPFDCNLRMKEMEIWAWDYSQGIEELM